MKTSRTYDFVWLGCSLCGFLLFCILLPTNPVFSILNTLLGVSILSLLFLSGRNPYDLRQIFFLANFVFLVLAARMDKSLGLLYWGSPSTVLEYYESVAMLSLIAMVFFAIAHLFGFRAGSVASSQHLEVNLREQKAISGAPLVIMSLFSVIMIYQQNSWLIESVFFREPIAGSRQFDSQMRMLLYYNTVFPLPAICLFLHLRNGRRSLIVSLTLVALLLIGNPPTGMARWQAAMLYGAVLITGFNKLSSKRHFFSFIMFIGLFLVFPILDLFRFFTAGVNVRVSSNWITQGHLDSAQSIARAIDIDFVSYGYQLLGALLFFIPRSLWPEKPIGSGHTIAGIMDLELDNISMHILGEGYVNFGYIGIFLFSSVLGFVFGIIDKRAWDRSSHYPVLTICYPFIVCWVFFFVRGDLMSSLAGIVGTIVTINFVFFVAKYFSRFSFSNRRIEKMPYTRSTVGSQARIP